MDKYVQRLFDEWKMHGKLVVAVDYDDTIFPYRLNDDEDVKDTIELVKDVHRVGAYIVIFTASNKARHQEIVDYCSKMDIPCDAINQNPIKLPYGNEGKIYYNINLCDRSGLAEAKRILKEAMYAMRGSNPSHLDNSEFAQFPKTPPYTT